MIPFLARNDVRLFLTSGTLLFVELLLIRWIPANVRYIGFFNNFLLMASFLGIGLGIILGRNGRRLPLSPFALLLFGVVMLVMMAKLDVQVQSSDELFFGLAESQAANTNFLVLPLAVILVTALMAALALPLGPLLKSLPPLRAYAIDIIGSMAGIAGFTVLSVLETGPFAWFLVTGFLVLCMALGTKVNRWSAVSGAAMLAVIYTMAMTTGRGEIWSPYYRIDTWDSTIGKFINVNGIPHQAMHAVDAPKEEFYEQVYRWFPGRTYDRVLVIGAGSGSDAALALARGAGHVDAVETRPEIFALGKEFHPDEPYDDPLVTPYINDGRAFLRNSNEKYDLVIFALPDSLTLVSTQASIRLESFLFTEEAFKSVSDHLDEDGVFVLYNYYRENWLIAKLAGMLEDAFGSAPLLQTYGSHKATLAAGPLVAALNGGAPPGDSVDPVPEAGGGPEPRPATDDWPFLYLRTPFVADYYLVALGAILIGAFAAVAIAAKGTGTSLRRFSPHFFVLGIAFLLLETRSLVSFSLLFGTTWIVNALAFFGVLASVLLAILINARWPIRRPEPFYVGLFVSIAVAYLLPPESLLFDPPALRYILAAALAFAPVFFANLVFSYSFRDTRTADMAFASNLLGAMVGGALEYLALLTGYQALLLVVAGLYALAYLFATRFRMFSDRELVSDRDLEPEPSLGAPRALPPEPAS